MINSNNEWRLIDSGYRTGSDNMSIDESLAHAVQKGESVSTVRLYRWQPWAISLGFHQHESDINIERCRQDHVDIVRRPTGGRAILHATELTYSVVTALNGRSGSDMYREISEALVVGLKTICPGVTYEMAMPDFSVLYRRQESIPCFSSSARYEIQIDGKKLVGSAQRRYTSPGYPEVVLQHGSILLGSEHGKLVEYLNISDDRIREKIANDFQNKTIDLTTACGRHVSHEEAADAIVSGFEQSWGISLKHQPEVAI